MALGFFFEINLSKSWSHRYLLIFTFLTSRLKIMPWTQLLLFIMSSILIGQASTFSLGGWFAPERPVTSSGRSMPELIFSLLSDLFGEGDEEADIMERLFMFFIEDEFIHKGGVGFE